MAASYKMYKNPPKNGEETERELHARIIPNMTVDIEYLAVEISQQSSFCSADVKGMLEAFTALITSHLKSGDNLNLQGLGSYSVSLKSPKGITKESQIRSESIRFKNVNFRCSSTMKSALHSMKLERKRAGKKESKTPEQRLQQILKDLQTNRSITASRCMTINQCSRDTALSDLNKLIIDSKIEKLGSGKSVLYLLKA